MQATVPIKDGPKDCELCFFVVSPLALRVLCHEMEEDWKERIVANESVATKMRWILFLGPQCFSPYKNLQQCIWLKHS